MGTTLPFFWVNFMKYFPVIDSMFSIMNDLTGIRVKCERENHQRVKCENFNANILCENWVKCEVRKANNIKL